MSGEAAAACCNVRHTPLADGSRSQATAGSTSRIHFAALTAASMASMRRLSLLAAVFCWCPAAVTSSAAGQETLIGVVGRDFILIGADTSASSSVALTSSTIDKVRVLSEPFPTGRANHRNYRDISTSNRSVGSGGGDDDEVALAQSWTQQTIAAAAAGESADCDRVCDILAAHCALREYETGVGCDVETVYDGSAAGHGVEDNHDGRVGSSSMIDATAPSGLDAESVAYLARSIISQSLRSRDRLSVCLLIAGMVKADATDDKTSDGNDTSYSGRLQRQVEAATSTYGGSRRASAVGTAAKSKEIIASTRSQHLAPRMFWLDEYGSIQQLNYGCHGYASNFALSILDRGYRPNMSREEATDLIKNCFEQLRTRYIINSPNPPRIKCIDADGCRAME